MDNVSTNPGYFDGKNDLEYKNRSNFPGKNDYVVGITLEDLIASGDEKQFPVDKAIILSGYVFNVKMCTRK